MCCVLCRAVVPAVQTMGFWRGSTNGPDGPKAPNIPDICGVSALPAVGLRTAENKKDKVEKEKNGVGEGT